MRSDGGILRRHAGRRELHRRARRLAASTVSRDEATALLDAVRRASGARRAEMIVIAPSRAAPLRFRAPQLETTPAPAPELSVAEQATLNALRQRPVLSSRDGDAAAPLSTLFAERRWPGGVVVGLEHDGHPLGMILLLDAHQRAARRRARDMRAAQQIAVRVSGALRETEEAISIDDNDNDEHLALRDSLTQLPTRAHFTERVRRSLGRLPTSQRPIAAIVLDVDGLAAVNDSHGRAAGDAVLRAVASQLGAQLRRLDTAARLEADEFAVLLDGVRNPSDARLVAQRIIESTRAPLTVEGVAISVTCSAGVVVVEDIFHFPSVDEVLRCAGIAMYLAKRQGRDRYLVFDRSARQPLVAPPEEPALHPAATG